MHYLYVIWPMLFPWVIFLPGALVEVFRRRSRRLLAAALFPLVWFGFMLLFFSAMQFRKDEYLMPAYPAMMLLVGLLLDRYLPRGRGARVDRSADPHLDRTIRGACLFVAFCAAGVVAFAAALRWEATVRPVTRVDDNRNTAAALGAAHRFVREQGWFVFAFAAVVAALLAVALWAQFSRRARLALAVLAVGAGLVTFTTIRVLMEQIDPHRSQRAFARVVREHARPATDDRPGDPLVLFRIEDHELVYWLDEAGRQQHGRSDAWEMYDLWPLRRPDAPAPTATAPDRSADLAPADSMKVIIARCRWWVRQGRTPYLVTDEKGLGFLRSRPDWMGLFATVAEPSDVGADYADHRTPPWLLRFGPDSD